MLRERSTSPFTPSFASPSLSSFTRGKRWRQVGSCESRLRRSSSASLSPRSLNERVPVPPVPVPRSESNEAAVDPAPDQGGRGPADDPRVNAILLDLSHLFWLAERDEGARTLSSSTRKNAHFFCSAKNKIDETETKKRRVEERETKTNKKEPAASSGSWRRPLMPWPRPAFLQPHNEANSAGRWGDGRLE